MAKYLVRINTSTGVGDALISSGNQQGAWVTDSTNTWPTTIALGEIFLDKYSRAIRCYNNNNANRAYWTKGSIYTSSPNNQTNVIDKLTYLESRYSIAATLSVARYRTAAGTLNSSIYVAGGMNAGFGDTNTIDKITYDNSCAAVANTLAAVKSECAGQATNFGTPTLYIFGGGAYGALNVIEGLTSDSTKATVTATLSVARNKLGDAAAKSWSGTAIYVFSGNTGSTTNVINKLTADSSCAAITSTLTAATDSTCANTMNDRIYCSNMGAQTNGAACATINKFTADGTACSSIAAAKNQWSFYSVGGEIGNNAYIMGGAYTSIIDKVQTDAFCLQISAALSNFIFGSGGANR